MVSFSFSRLLMFCPVLAGLSHAIPTPPGTRGNDVHPFNPAGLIPPSAVEPPNAAILNHTQPWFVVYGDSFTSGVTGPPPTSQIDGFNVFVLAFLLTEGASDKVEEWTQLTHSQRSSIKARYAEAGVKLIVSAFGSTDAPTSRGKDPIATANTMAAFVKTFELDGIDVDYEDLDAFNAGNGSAEKWLIRFTRQLRTQLPQGQFILTHAPIAPWFSSRGWGGGGYMRIHNAVGTSIDWYNVQFYNQGTDEYTTCRGLLTSSSSNWPQTSVFEIAANGVDINKIVIGKPGTPGDASNGYIDPNTLSGCVAQAAQQGWNAGVMVWEFPDANSKWIQTVRSLAFPK